MEAKSKLGLDTFTKLGLGRTLLLSLDRIDKLNLDRLLLVVLGTKTPTYKRKGKAIEIGQTSMGPAPTKVSLCGLLERTIWVVKAG
ncbi:unnamed protein product [Dovyalis caffra]|uniref:Uncharacterized protein n=1 Tax=Dovyalis caffra TaxID=77055 RepID=A0AAV1RRF9_9ROSI|nr:unnamed protein product [Dovyalis caffra]